MKRLTSIFLLVMLLVGSVGTVGFAESTIDFDEAPYELVVLYPVLSEAQPDLQLISDAISEITLREINATVKFEAISLFSTANILALKASSGEQMDLVCLMPGSSYLAAFANSKLIRPFDEELDAWGADITAVLGDSLESGRFNGQQYAIPQNKGLDTNGYGYNFSVPLAEKYGIDINEIKTMEDMEAAFAIIKENEPEVVVITPEQSGSSVSVTLGGKQESLGTTTLSLQVEDDGTLTVTSYHAQDYYKEAVTKAREWYELGYISKDVAANQESGSQMLWGGKAFSTAATSLGSAMGGLSNGVEYRSVMLEDDLMRATIDSLMTIWTIPSVSKRPDKAIQFLNLAFSNEEIGNLFRYGIEGNHYVIREDGAADRINTGGWQNNWYLLGDYNKIMMQADAVDASGVSPDEYRELDRLWNERTALSAAYGFLFDPANVRTEIAACDSVIDEYSRALGNGTVDPETELTKFNKALEDAGVQTIIDEAQRQLDEWVAAK